MPDVGEGRRFLFLQGPHGPFFRQLTNQLEQSGATCWRVGFNYGDQAFCGHEHRFIPYHGRPDEWSDTLSFLVAQMEITDIVLYGDVRPVHASARKLAAKRNLTLHVFEEGYLRPYWVTYERGGSNGHSRLMEFSIDDIRARLGSHQGEQPEAPATWGDMKHHIFYGAVYHGLVMLGARHFPLFRPHRSMTIRQEFRLHLRRLALMPFHWMDRVRTTAKVRRGSFPYHLAILQLEHDSSFTAHSPFSSMTDFVRAAIRGFSEGAPSHHHLVFKAHPLEDGRTPLKADIRRIAKDHGVEDRVHFLRGGKLATLLDTARSAVTINSTAGQQVLWRGKPLKIFGTAVYGRPELVSGQTLEDFFAAPVQPDLAAYHDFRNFLLATSQIPGGFYSARGRRRLLRLVVDKMLDHADPYDALNLTSTRSPEALEAAQ